jgi:hypothetical protein
MHLGNLPTLPTCSVHRNQPRQWRCNVATSELLPPADGAILLHAPPQRCVTLANHTLFGRYEEIENGSKNSSSKIFLGILQPDDLVFPYAALKNSDDIIANR